ncbi:hypothetical protein C8R48DRAFT_674620 [Suillus tomentosus]|nr:hypothetical protein C8R48DRAFT_674620 [Suillus tomentosus]
MSPWQPLNVVAYAVCSRNCLQFTVHEECLVLDPSDEEVHQDCSTSFKVSELNCSNEREIMSAFRTVFSNVIYEGHESRISHAAYCIDDFTDAASVAVSPALLTTGPACRNSPNSTKLFPPNGIRGRLHMMQQSLSTLSHAASLMAGSSSQTIALAFRGPHEASEDGWNYNQ